MDLIVADDVAAARVDSGDLIDACQSGIARWEDVVPLERFVGSGAPQDGDGLRGGHRPGLDVVHGQGEGLAAPAPAARPSARAWFNAVR